MAKVSYETITTHESFNLKTLQDAAKEMNESGLLGKKINTVGVTKEKAVKLFLDAIEKLSPEDVKKMPDAPFDLNNAYIDILNAADTDDGGAEDPVVEPKVEEKITKVAEKKTKKVISPKVSGRKLYAESLIEEQKYTRQEAVEMILKKFPEVKKSTVSTMISDWANPKYAPFADKIAVKDEDGILSFRYLATEA